MKSKLPEHFHSIDNSEQFCFACHPGVACFTECCRQLDLVLTPYDVLRLKNRLQTHSGKFLEQYLIIEWEEGMVFPACYLTMVDDGRASCIFVSDKGCSVYEDRPGACRAYPVGRGASRKGDGTVTEQYVLVKEPHCRGFEEKQTQNVSGYFQDQGLADYNRFNDPLMQLLQHPRVHFGFRPSKAQLDHFILALYNLDMFRQEMADGRISMNRPLSTVELQALAGNDEELLLLGIRWLMQEFFAE
ncbi:MAG: YkgJ family cysteine cluster protein [Deltaproteobacteria bacterium]|nr:YkgJ family cysteine cluster protein [Deltaproteobacteria bacterium]